MITEGKHAGEWMVSMAPCQLWVEVGSVAAGEGRVLVTGSIMMAGANPGEYTEWDLTDDGSADPVAILFSADVDATGADAATKVLFAKRQVQANRAELTYATGATAAQILYAETVLAENQHIVVRDSCGD